MVLFQKKKERCSISLDIGTETVKVLVASLKEERGAKKITILGNSLLYFDNFDLFDSKDFGENVFQRAIFEAINEARLNSLRICGKKVQNQKDWPVFIALPANVLRGRVVFQTLSRENFKEIIDKKEEEFICQEILKAARTKISDSFLQEFGILPQDIHFTNLKILERKIDGYDVPALYGYDGKNLNFRILAIFSPKYHLRIIENIVKILGLKYAKIFHQAESFLSCAAERKDGIFLDIGGSLTQFFIIKKGKLEKIDEFDTGGKAFSRALSEVLGIDIETARLLKEKYSKGFLSEGARKRVKGIFSRPLEDWFGNLKLKLSVQKNFLPSVFFLFGGGSLLPDIQEILEDGDWRNVPIISPPEVKYIYPKDFQNIIDSTKNLNSPKDTSPILILRCNTSTLRHRGQILQKNLPEGIPRPSGDGVVHLLQHRV